MCALVTGCQTCALPIGDAGDSGHAPVGVCDAGVGGDSVCGVLVALEKGQSLGNTVIPVGAGLLAKATCQLMHVPTDTPLSRASTTPHLVRKRVGEGKGGAVRVEHGGGRINNKHK